MRLSQGPRQLFQTSLRKEQCAATLAELLVHSSSLAEGQEKCNILVNCPRYWQIYQEDFSKVVILKSSTKGVVCCSFRKGSCTWPSVGKNLLEMQRLSLIVPRTGKIYQWNFPKVLVLKRSTRKAMSSSLRRAPCA